MYRIGFAAGRSLQERPDISRSFIPRLGRGPGFIGLLFGAVAMQSAPAVAAGSQGQASVTIVPGLNAAMIDNLTFGTISPPETGTASVTVLLSGNDVSTCGTGLTCFEMGNRASLRLSGAPRSRVSVTAPGTITLSDALGNMMTVDDFTLGSGSGAVQQTFRMDALGTQTVYIGATLHIPSAQPPGLYSGTYTVTASYE